VVACEPTPQLLGRLDTRSVVVTPEEALTAAARSWPASRPSPARGRRLRRQLQKVGQSSVEQVLAAVRAAGVHHQADIVTEDPDLEDVFLALTYGDPEQGDPTRD
jgi:ABC-2 type transport system ATP-binding protein